MDSFPAVNHTVLPQFEIEEPGSSQPAADTNSARPGTCFGKMCRRLERFVENTPCGQTIVAATLLSVCAVVVGLLFIPVLTKLGDRKTCEVASVTATPGLKLDHSPAICGVRTPVDPGKDVAHWLDSIEAVLTCADNLSSIVNERDIADRLKTFQSIGSRYALSDSYASAVGGLKLALESMGLRTCQQNYRLGPGHGGVAANTCKASDGHSCNLFTIIPGESNRVILLGSHLFSPVDPAVDVAVAAAANASVAAANNAASAYTDYDGAVAEAGYTVADIAHDAADQARLAGADAVADATDRSATHVYAAGDHEAAADAAYAANAALVAAASFSDGANDNGSGVVSTLEMARILSQSGLKLKHPVVISLMGKDGFNAFFNDPDYLAIIEDLVTPGDGRSGEVSIQGFIDIDRIGTRNGTFTLTEVRGRTVPTGQASTVSDDGSLNITEADIVIPSEDEGYATASGDGFVNVTELDDEGYTTAPGDGFVNVTELDDEGYTTASDDGFVNVDDDEDYTPASGDGYFNVTEMEAGNHTAASSNSSFTVTESAGGTLPGGEEYISWGKDSFTTTEADADMQLQLADEDAKVEADDSGNELLSLFSGYFEDNGIDFIVGTSSSSVMHSDLLEQEFPVVQLSAGFDSRIGQSGDNLANVDIQTMTNGTRALVNVVTQLAMSEDWQS